MKNEPQILEMLAYISYATNRDNGMTHEQLLSIGIGDNDFKFVYENESKHRSQKKIFKNLNLN